MAPRRSTVGNLALIVCRTSPFFTVRTRLGTLDTVAAVDLDRATRWTPKHLNKVGFSISVNHRLTADAFVAFRCTTTPLTLGFPLCSGRTTLLAYVGIFRKDRSSRLVLRIQSVAHKHQLAYRRFRTCPSSLFVSPFGRYIINSAGFCLRWSVADVSLETWKRWPMMARRTQQGARRSGRT